MRGDRKSYLSHTRGKLCHETHARCIIFPVYISLSLCSSLFSLFLSLFLFLSLSLFHLLSVCQATCLSPVPLPSSLLGLTVLVRPSPRCVVSPVPVNEQDPDWTDTFEVEVSEEEGQLYVWRVDINAKTGKPHVGWGQNLTLECVHRVLFQLPLDYVCHRSQTLSSTFSSTLQLSKA